MRNHDVLRVAGFSRKGLVGELVYRARGNPVGPVALTLSNVET